MRDGAMNRRSLLGLLLAAPALLSGCGLSERPYAERRQWPLAVRRPTSQPPRRGGRVLLVRSLRAGPGMDARGLQSLRADGSIRSEFYEEWAVPPNEAVEDALRRWLADSGRFAAVIGPGSRLASDITLEGELTALWTVAATSTAYAALGITAIEQPSGTPRIRLQQTFTAQAPLANATQGTAVQGMDAALAEIFGNIEQALVRGEAPTDAAPGRRRRQSSAGRNSSAGHTAVRAPSARNI
jgi:cholesterol transport system auxiliary component